MAQTPINSMDIGLQALQPRVTASTSNFISLAANSLEFVYGAANEAAPSVINIKAQLSGVLRGTVTFVVTGLKAGTNLVLDSTDKNILLLDPASFEAYSVTVTAKLTFGNVEYISSPISISKRYTSILTRITRAYDSVRSLADGSGYTLPTRANTLELFNGTNKLTTDVKYGFQSTSNTSVTVDGLTLSVDPNTGELTLSGTTWDKDSTSFNLTATFGLSVYSSTYTITKIREGSTAKLLDPAPTPVGVTITAGFNYVFIECGTPDYATGHGHDKTQVYAQEYSSTITPLIGDTARTKLVTEFKGTVGSFNAKPNTAYRIWLKWVTNDGVASVNPYPTEIVNNVLTQVLGGYAVTTGADVSKVVDALTGPDKPFVILTEAEAAAKSITDGVTYTAGTYSTQSFIKTAQIGTAQIKTAAITNAKIADLSANKITTGILKVGTEISSNGFVAGSTGWIIKANGTAEFSAASIRGKLTANNIDGTGLSIKNAVTGETILDAGVSIQEQIKPYSLAAGTSINLDPTCSSITAWNKDYIKTITGGITGNKVLSDNAGAALLEGITTAKAFKINYDPQKRYQLSALIRKTGTLVGSGDVHIGLLEFDQTEQPRYDWGGFLGKKIPVSDLTTSFKRYYAYFAPGDLNAQTSRISVHAVLGYPNTGDASTLVQIQDIKLEDITLGHRVQYSAVNTAAVDATDKVDFTQNYLEGNMGKNSWVVRRYSTTPTENTVPVYSQYTSVSPVQTILLEDTDVFTGSTLFGSYNNYFASATTNVYCENPITWSTKVTSSVPYNILINGTSANSSTTSTSLKDVTLNFPKGWSVLEIVWTKLISSDSFRFSSAIASKSQITPGPITEMWALVGGGMSSITTTASAAQTAVWENVKSIPYDKILSNDATTTLGFNPSFEQWQGQYPLNWQNWTGSPPTKEVADTRFGSYGVKFVVTTENNVGITRTSSWASAPMAANTFVAGTVDLKITQKVSGGLPGMLVRLFTNTSLTTYVDTKVQANALFNDWQRLAFTARTDVDQQIYGIQVFLMGSWDSFTGGVFRGTVIFDGLTFSFFDNTIDNKTIKVNSTTGALEGTGTTSTVIVDNTKVVVGGANLMRNSNRFVVGNTTGWTAENSSTAVSISSAIPYGSYNTLQIVGNSSSQGVYNNNVMRLKADTEYTVSATVKGTGNIPTGSNSTLHVRVWTAPEDIAAGNIYKATILNYDTAVTTSWKTIYQTFKTPASSNPVYCRFYFYPITNAQINALFIKLEQGNKVTDWIPSSDEVGETIEQIPVINTKFTRTVKNNEANILAAADGFTIQTPNYTQGNGLILNAGGIIGKKSGNTTFAIDATTGEATFSGTITASLLQDAANGNFIIDLNNKFISISI
jgi:hypothetical protein